MNRYVASGIWSGLLAIAATAQAATDDDPCKVTDNMDALRACMNQDNQREVDQAFARVRKAIAVRQAGAAQQLDEAQQAWSAFRDASCEYSAAAAPEGIYPEDARAQCIASFSAARVRVLDAYRREFRTVPKR